MGVDGKRPIYPYPILIKTADVGAALGVIPMAKFNMV